MLAIIWREIRLHYTKAYWLISNFLTPLFYLVFFGIIFSGVVQHITIANQRVTYLHFFIPGLMVMQSFFVLSFTLALVNLDLRTRIIEMIHMTATSFSEYYFGRIISIQILAFVKIGVLYIFSRFVLGLASTSFFSLVIIALIFILSNFIWFNIGFTLGLIIKTEDIRDIVMQFITLPLTFLSTIYYPSANAPAGLKFLVFLNPLTHATNIIRPTLLNAGGLNAGSVFILLGYGAVSFVLSLVFIRKWSTVNR